MSSMHKQTYQKTAGYTHRKIRPQRLPLEINPDSQHRSICLNCDQQIKLHVDLSMLHVALRVHIEQCKESLTTPDAWISIAVTTQRQM
jgi:hypothetical protein